MCIHRYARVCVCRMSLCIDPSVHLSGHSFTSVLTYTVYTLSISMYTYVHPYVTICLLTRTHARACRHMDSAYALIHMYMH